MFSNNMRWKLLIQIQQGKQLRQSGSQNWRINHQLYKVHIDDSGYLHDTLS